MPPATDHNLLFIRFFDISPWGKSSFCLYYIIFFNELQWFFVKEYLLNNYYAKKFKRIEKVVKLALSFFASSIAKIQKIV